MTQSIACLAFTSSIFVVLLGNDPAACDDSAVHSNTDATAAFRIWPYLQLPAPTGITVIWETDRQSAGKVRFGLDSNLDQAAEQASPRALHQVRLQGLRPSTKYFYRVECGSLMSPIYSFRSAPPLGASRWRVAVYGDSRSNPDVHRLIARRITLANVDLIIHSGDIVLDGRNPASWRKEFFEPLGDLARSVPWISTIGNHESDLASYTSYAPPPEGHRYYGYDFANAHFVCLDSNSWIEKGRDSDQYRWLENHLGQKRNATWQFAVFHHGLFSAHASRPINPLRWEWAPILLDPCSRINGVLTGHDHFYARNYPMGLASEPPVRGVQFLTSAGGGAPLYPCRKWDFIASESMSHHFTLLEFDGDRIHGQAIDVSGAVLDRFEWTKSSPAAQEFCAFEIEQLKEHVRAALQTAASFQTHFDHETAIETMLEIPTRFRIPLEGELEWQAVPGWRIESARSRFRLEPHEKLKVPIKARIAAGSFDQKPQLKIRFDPGHFRNREIVAYPLKLAGPDEITIGKNEWTERYGLIASATTAGRVGALRFKRSDFVLTVEAQLQSTFDFGAGSAHMKISAAAMSEENLRIMLSDGKVLGEFVVSPAGHRFASANHHDDRTTNWEVARAPSKGTSHDWQVNIRIPIPASGDLRINACYHKKQGLDYTDYWLNPAYELTGSPALIPDWKPNRGTEAMVPLRLAN